MRSENQPLLGDKKKNRSSSQQASSPPMAVPAPTADPRDLEAAAGGDEPLLPPSHQRTSSVGGVYDFAAQRGSLGGVPFVGPMSLPASPPFEAGPVRHYVDGPPDSRGRGGGDDMTTPRTPFGHALTHSNSHPLEDLGLATSLQRAQTVGPGGSYTPRQHMMEMMTPGRGGGGGGDAGSEDGDGGNGRNAGRSTSYVGDWRGSGGNGRPEPHIEEALFDLDPDFDLSASHLMKMFNLLDRDKNGRLTYEELREGLLSMRGMHTIPAAKVDQVGFGFGVGGGLERGKETRKALFSSTHLIHLSTTTRSSVKSTGTSRTTFPKRNSSPPSSTWPPRPWRTPPVDREGRAHYWSFLCMIMARTRRFAAGCFPGWARGPWTSR